MPEGAWIDPIYLIAATCLGAQAWQRRTETIRSSARFDGWRELMVPALFFAVMIGLFVMQSVSARSGLATVLWAATMIAVIVRLGMSVRENKLLVAQVRTDPMTGLLSRGALQIDLDGICAKATEDEPITVLLFDLNGFKSYNDTCGHPAGDELLSGWAAGCAAGSATTASPTGSAATSSASSSSARDASTRSAREAASR